MSDYKVIPCALHEHYQLAVMQRLPLDLTWCGEVGEITQARVYPLDVYTKDGAEFLLVRAEALGEVVIRLDHIQLACWVFNGRLLG